MTSEAASPVAEPLEFPEGYGRPASVLGWETVRTMLVEATQYWFATVRAGPRPHVVPLDGIWLDDVWYHGGSPATVHRRSVSANPQAVMHLPDPWKVVIVEGEVRWVRPGEDVARRLADLNNDKYPDYGLTFTPDQYEQVSALYPSRVLAWTAFPKDATRFLFG